MLLASATPVLAQVQTPAARTTDWHFVGGIGVMAAPKFAGSDKTGFQLLPLFEASYRQHFFIGTLRGAGVQTRVSEQLSLSAALAPDLQRRRPKDDARLARLGEIKLAPALRLGAELNAGPLRLGIHSSTRLGKRGEFGGRGSSVEFEAGYGVQPLAGLGLVLGVSAQLMDGKLAGALFGVTPAQAAATGLKVHAAEAGLTRLGVFTQASYPLDKDWRLQARLDLGALRGDAASSPVVKKKLQPGLMLMASRAY